MAVGSAKHLRSPYWCYGPSNEAALEWGPYSSKKPLPVVQAGQALFLRGKLTPGAEAIELAASILAVSLNARPYHVEDPAARTGVLALVWH